MLQLDPCVTKLLKSQTVISDLPDAVRETLQNSLDASASHIKISVDFKHFSFTITDNGEGITPSDLDKITSRYYTSKLACFDQLKELKTWGFRGEALNSLSSISNLTIVSRAKEHNGVYSVTFNQGKKLNQSMLLDSDNEYVKELKGTSGTILVVKALFLNIPVRLEYLSKTSKIKILEELRFVLLQCLVAYPSVSIELFEKVGLVKQIICKYTSNQDHNYNKSVITAISSIYGIIINNHNNCLEITYKNYNVKCIFGTLPVQSKAYQFIYWNKRVLNDSDLFKFINKTFQDADFGTDSKELLIASMKRSELSPKKGRTAVKLATTVGNPFTKHPVFVINITGPVSISDLIQDSDKSVYVSKHWSIVQPLISKIVKSFLKMNGYKVYGLAKPGNEELHEGTILSPRKNMSTVEANAKLLLNSRLRMGKVKEREINSMISTKKSSMGSPTKSLKNTEMIEGLVKRRRLISKEELSCKEHSHGNHFDLQETPHDIKITIDVIRDCNVIKQIDSKFILIKHKEQLYIIDQHACDERIRVESLLKRTIETARDPFSDLSVPLKENSFNLSLSNMDFELFQSFIKQFHTWGIKYYLREDIQAIEITHLPELLHPKIDINYSFIQRSLTQYAHDLHNHVKLKSPGCTEDSWYQGIQALPTILQDLINSKACRSAVMFGTKLDKRQCESLIDELRNCVRPYWCAHGRPSIVPLCDLRNLKRDDVKI